jgi:hypothetical protein
VVGRTAFQLRNKKVNAISTANYKAPIMNFIDDHLSLIRHHRFALAVVTLF